LAQLPRGVGGDCKAYRDRGEFDPFDAGATAAVSCDFGAGSLAEVALFKFPDEQKLSEYYRQRTTDVGLESYDLDDSYCTTFDRGDFAAGSGRVACWISQSGTRRAHVRWTDPRNLVYGVADARNDDLASIYDWWSRNMK